jgi:transcriptional regulator with XRE-family HTH domain
MSIGSNIKTKRIEKRLSQEVLAEKLHVSQATLSNIEVDKSVPDVILLKQIAEVLNTNINELLDGKTVFVKNNNQNGGVDYPEVVNQLSQKLIELYEKQLKIKDKMIKKLKEKLKSSK